MTETVRILLPILDMPCIDLPITMTDEQMDAECFRNVYKSVTGVNPHGFTPEQAQEWMRSYVGPDRDYEEEDYLMAQADMMADYLVWEKEQEEKKADYGFYPWQIQAGRLSLSESIILEY